MVGTSSVWVEVRQEMIPEVITKYSFDGWESEAEVNGRKRVP